MCDCELPDFISLAWRKARHCHQCDECCRRIECGERYYNIRGKWTGEFGVFKQCISCARCSMYHPAFSEECICYGGLSEFLHQRYSDHYWNIKRLKAKPVEGEG